MADIFSQILTSGAVSGFIIWIVKEHLKSAISHEYAEKLTRLKSELQSENSERMARFQAAIDQLKSIQSLASSSFSACQTSSHEKTLSAVQSLWGILIEIGRNMPGAVASMDVILKEEYESILENEKFEQKLEMLSQKDIDIIMEVSKSGESLRPFVGEYLFGLFWAYRAIAGRIVYLLIQGYQGRKLSPWYEDKAMQSLLAVIMDEQERKQFESVRLSQFLHLTYLLQAKAVNHMSRMISGEASSASGLEQGKKIVMALSDFEIGSKL